jgi:DNA polymerase elongation subunit (family B)
MGVAILDYLDMYKKYRYTPREKYTLDFISRAENPEEHKLEFKGTHGSLYYDDPVFFVDYNVQDVRCVVNFEKKLQMLQLCTYLSYFSNINFEDNYSPIKIWETIIAKSCLDEGLVIPMRFKTPEKKPYEGAYVHEPVPGLKGCIASFDYTSLYPKIMELFYIGADVHQTGEAKKKLYEDLLKVLDNGNEECHKMLTEIKTTGIFNDFYINHDMPADVTKFLKERGVSLTTNCEFYDVSKKSIFVSLITKLFLERKADKKTSFKFKHQAQEIKEELKKRGIEISEEH